MSTDKLAERIREWKRRSEELMAADAGAKGTCWERALTYDTCVEEMEAASTQQVSATPTTDNLKLHQEAYQRRVRLLREQENDSIDAPAASLAPEPCPLPVEWKNKADELRPLNECGILVAKAYDLCAADLESWLALQRAEKGEK